MNPLLASRKQILIAASERNRAQMVQDWQMMTDEAQALADRARTIRSVATAAAAFGSGLFLLWRHRPAATAQKPSWLQTLLKGAGTVSALWSRFRAPAPDSKPE